MAAVNTEAIPMTTNSVLSINMSHVSKLTSSNYLAWSLQIHSFLNGYGLVTHLDETTVVPAATVVINNTTSANAAYTKWIRQDNLIYSALLGVVSPSLQPLVSRCTTAAQIWTTLANTYAKPSRGHIKQLKNQLKYVSKGTQKIDEYIQGVKSKFDQLAILGKPYEHEDAIEIILDGLQEEYRSVVEQMDGKDLAPFLIFLQVLMLLKVVWSLIQQLCHQSFSRFFTEEDVIMKPEDARLMR